MRMISIKSAVGRPLLSAVYWTLVRLSTRYELRGIRIADSTVDGGDPNIRIRLDEALDLLQRTSPRHFERVRKAFSCVLVEKFSGPSFIPIARICILSRSLVIDGDVADICLLLMHEATHDRLNRLGFRYEPEMRARIERLCVLAELDLARVLPDSERLIAVRLNIMEREWWTPAAQAKRAMWEIEQRVQSRFWSKVIQALLRPR